MKLKKEKLFVSLVVVILLALIVGNLYTFATESGSGTSAGSIVAKSNNSKQNGTDTNSVGATNTNKNTNSNIVPSTVGATNNTSKQNKANTNKNSSNTSRYSNSKNNGSLPYAGSGPSVVFVVIALGVSAIYAYKKVSDYNI